MQITNYPEFKALSLDMRDQVHNRLFQLTDGISEFTFANLYLFRNTYNYQIAELPGNKFILKGTKNNKTFALLPEGLPDYELLAEILQTTDYIKCVSETIANSERIALEQINICINEDRDNFDYLYLRKDLALLAGRKYHKKRNLVNAFLNNYSYKEVRINEENMQDAFYVLEKWKELKDGIDGDYEATKEALEKKQILQLCGCMYYVDGKPAAFSLGEEINKGKCYAVHFEKAIEEYKGIYQFINRAFAAILPHRFIHINREQDLGDLGLRQAKMSYRPSGFVKKYIISKQEKCKCISHCFDNDLS